MLSRNFYQKSMKVNCHVPVISTVQSLTLFVQKFRESNALTKEVTKVLISRNIFSEKAHCYFFYNVCQYPLSNFYISRTSSVGTFFKNPSSHSSFKSKFQTSHISRRLWLCRLRSRRYCSPWGQGRSLRFPRRSRTFALRHIPRRRVKRRLRPWRLESSCWWAKWCMQDHCNNTALPMHL